jgi:glutathione S-transferase
MTVRLSGYEHSVYSWIARLALGEKHVDFEWLEVNPFDASPPENFQRLNSFGRVPVLQDGDFIV